MKKTIQHSFLVLCLLFSALTSFSQQSLKQVFVLNEGHYDYGTSTVTVPATLATYNPQTQVYTVIDTIKNVRFASDLLIDGGFIYAAADTLLIKYDMHTLQRVAVQTIPGIRKMAVSGNLIYVTRGDVDAHYNSFFQAYDKSNLQFSYELDTLTGPKYQTEGVVVKNGVAYIAINNGFIYGANVGKIGQVELSNQTYVNETDLGINGQNPENLMVKNGSIYSLNNKDFSSSSISQLEIQSSNATTYNLYTNGGCNGSALVNNNIAFQSYNDNFLGLFNTQTSSYSDSLKINKYIYQIASDTLNNNIYVSETDYTTYGTVLIYDQHGNPVSSFTASVSPGHFAFDFETATSAPTVKPVAEVQVYPTLVRDQLTVIAKGIENENATITVNDCLGRVVYSQSGSGNNLSISRIDLAQQPAGVYFVNVKGGATNYSQKVVKM